MTSKTKIKHRSKDEKLTHMVWMFLDQIQVGGNVKSSIELIYLVFFHLISLFMDVWHERRVDLSLSLRVSRVPLFGNSEN